MQNIQIMFFSVIFTVMLVMYFFLLYRDMKREKQIKSTAKDLVQIKEYCNMLFDKLKEIVDKVNPILKDLPEDNVQEAKIKEEK